MEGENTDRGSEPKVRLGYIRPDVALTMAQIQRYRDDNLRLSLGRKKLHLILDLDHTLLHARKSDKLTADEKERIKSIPDVHEMFGGEYVVRLRPGVGEFIQQVRSMFDVSIYTMGSRPYAKEVYKLLYSQVGFPNSAWVMAREDCTIDRQKSLDVVLSHQRVVVIVDDAKQVWGESCAHNLVKISRYDFFPINNQQGVEEVDTELARVLSILKKVHHSFYYDGSTFEANNGGEKDVRELLNKLGAAPILPLPDDDANNEERSPINYSGECHEDRKIGKSDDQESSTTKSRKRLRSEDENNQQVVDKKCKLLVTQFNEKSASILEAASSLVY